MSASTPGKVYLVGAGPGDAELLTLRGVRCLQRADLVLYDYLVNPRMLRHARAGAELVCLGRHGRERIWSQDEVNARMVAAALAGNTVVRLKAGDPTIFARLAEELAALEQAALEYEIVPGVTAAMAAGAYAGIPLTQRDAASAVAFVTGQESAKATAEGLDYAALAKFPGTLVFYMGITTAPEWSQALIAAGKSPETPVAIVRRISWPDQHSRLTTLSELAELLQREHVRPPAMIIVGEVAAAKRWREWFIARPLFGQRILVTRPAHQANDLVDQLAEAGADVLIQPAIEIVPPEDWNAVDHAIDRLGEFDWLVFSSANGVRSLIDRLLLRRKDIRQLGPAKLAAIGPATAAELKRYGLSADVIPDEYRAEALAAALAPRPGGKRVLLVRASRGREVLAEQLRGAGWQVEQVVVYQSRDVKEPDEDVLAELRAGRIDWVTVTSSAIARSTMRLFGDALKHTQLASISSLTSEVCAAAGFAPVAEATEATMAGLVAAIVAAERGHDSAAG
jgi:uroporphyrinogen III methyltransferase/synthase